MSTIPARAAGAIALAGRPTARIGYGMGALTGAVSAGRLTGDAAVSLLRHAGEEGAQFFDTAEFYGQGLANQLLARAFGSHRDEVVFTTEVGARPVPGAVPMTAAQRPDELRQAVEANLRSLGTDRLDLVHLRRMDMPPGLVITDPQQLVDLDDQLAALEALRESGTIGAIGLSHVSLAQLERALPAGISAVSNIYNLLDRTHEPLLRLAETGAMVWAPTSRSGRRLSRAARPQPAVAGHRRHLLRRPSRREHRRSDPATAAGGARPARCRGLSAMSHRPACSSQRVPPRTRRGDSLSCEP